MRDLHNNILLKNAITPVVVTDNTAQTSAAIDRQGYDAVEFLINLGTLADADTTVAVKLTECDTSGGSYTDVAAADLLGTTTEAGFQFDDDGEVRKLGYVGIKRFVKVVVTPSNNTGNIPLAATAILAKAGLAPITQTAS
jgi:hypothetical protein